MSNNGQHFTRIQQMRMKRDRCAQKLSLGHVAKQIIDLYTSTQGKTPYTISQLRPALHRWEKGIQPTPYEIVVAYGHILQTDHTRYLGDDDLDVMPTGRSAYPMFPQSQQTLVSLIEEHEGLSIYEAQEPCIQQSGQLEEDNTKYHEILENLTQSEQKMVVEIARVAPHVESTSNEQFYSTIGYALHITPSTARTKRSQIRKKISRHLHKQSTCSSYSTCI